MSLELGKLLYSYNNSNHEKLIEKSTKNFSISSTSFAYMQENSWLTQSSSQKVGSLPVKIVSQIIDSYSLLERRPDMSFLHLWMAFNSTFHDLSILKASQNPQKHKITDSYGIDAACEVLIRQKSLIINNLSLSIFYGEILNKVPEKLCSMIASSFLKTIVVAKNNLSKRYESRSIQGIASNYAGIYDLVYKTFGESYANNCSASLNSGTLQFQHKDPNKSREITKALSKEIKKMLSTGNISAKDKLNGKQISITLSSDERLEFFVNYILYASRNNMSHGQAASRLTSSTANIDSYKSSFYLYVVCYIFISILFYDLNYSSINSIEQTVKNLILL